MTSRLHVCEGKRVDGTACTRLCLYTRFCKDHDGPSMLRRNPLQLLIRQRGQSGMIGQQQQPLQDHLGPQCRDIQFEILAFLDSGDHFQLARVCYEYNTIVTSYFNMRYRNVDGDVRMMYGFNASKPVSASAAMRKFHLSSREVAKVPLFAAVPARTPHARPFSYYLWGDVFKHALASRFGVWSSLVKHRKQLRNSRERRQRIQNTPRRMRMAQVHARDRDQNPQMSFEPIAAMFANLLHV